MPNQLLDDAIFAKDKNGARRARAFNFYLVVFFIISLLFWSIILNYFFCNFTTDLSENRAIGCGLTGISFLAFNLYLFRLFLKSRFQEIYTWDMDNLLIQKNPGVMDGFEKELFFIITLPTYCLFPVLILGLGMHFFINFELGFFQYLLYFLHLIHWIVLIKRKGTSIFDASDQLAFDEENSSNS